MGGGRAAARPTTDPVATRVLTKGESIQAPSGRADDFSWPRGSAAPVTEPVALQPTPAAPAPAAAPPAPGATAQSKAGQRTATDGQAAEPTSRPQAPKRVRQPDAPRPPLFIPGLFR